MIRMSRFLVLLAVLSCRSFEGSLLAGPEFVFVTHPSNTTVGAVIAPAVKIQLRYPSGRTATESVQPVTIQLGGNDTASPTLNGTLTRTPVNGIVTFDDLTIDKPFSAYQLFVYGGDIPSAHSRFFAITP